jgi:hypothetical protein
MFYEAAHEKWPDVYEQLTAGDIEFKISKRFRRDPNAAGPAIPIDTFVLTPRGPVFAFPVRLPDPIRETGLDAVYLERFSETRRGFFSAIPGRTILRVGLVREVVFSTEKTNLNSILSRQSEWAGARLVGGNRLIQYRDDKCNIRLEMRPCEISKTTQLPIGPRVDERVGYGLWLRLDINNTEVKPLQETDIEDVVTRADGFWPQKVVQYLAAEEL